MVKQVPSYFWWPDTKINVTWHKEITLIKQINWIDITKTADIIFFFFFFFLNERSNEQGAQPSPAQPASTRHLDNSFPFSLNPQGDKNFFFFFSNGSYLGYILFYNSIIMCIKLILYHHIQIAFYSFQKRKNELQGNNKIDWKE